MAQEPSRTRIVMCIGNAYMHDDGLGIEVAKELRKSDLGEGVEVIERQLPDLSVLLRPEGALGIIIVDALKSGARPGTLTKLRVGEKGSPSLRVPLAHELGLDDLIEFAGRNAIPLCPITVIGVEPASCEVGEGLTNTVAEALPSVLSEVVEELRRFEVDWQDAHS